jgi:hypothetical protein
MTHQGRTCRAQSYPSAVALEQGGAQALLQLADRMTDRAWRNVQFRGGLIERPGTGGGLERTEQGQGRLHVIDELDSRVVVKIAFAGTTNKADHSCKQDRKK